ncbi:MAG: PQQ-binding-like beta-propeller repeat protein [Mariniblastus sp.]
MNYRLKFNNSLEVCFDFPQGNKRISRIAFSFVTCCFLCCVFCCSSSSQGQINPKRKQNANQGADTQKGREALEAQLVEDAFKQGERSVFLPAPREILRPLIRARRALQENDMARAVTLLGEVLTDTTTEDFLIPDPTVDGVSTSLRKRAQSILGALPTKDRELYRVRYGVQAKQMLQKAIETGDYQQVSEVMIRFFYTDAGYDAAMLLGHYHLDQGRPIAAASCFERITQSEEARTLYDPEASVLLATCLMMSDAPDRAAEVLVSFQSKSSRRSFQFMGKPVRMFDKPKDAGPWLKKLIGESPLKDIAVVNQWVMVGGNPQRNARSGTGFPLLSPRWATPTVNNPDLEDAVKDRQTELIALGSSPIPSVQPLAVGDTIVMRAFDRMIGVDFKTGKRVWVFPPWNFATRFETPKQRIKKRTVKEDSLTERMWMDSIYGQASSDGKRIFVVPKPGFSSEVSTDGLNEDSEPALGRTYNEMMAIDIGREGAFSWEVGGESGLDEPKLAKSFFLGPPLPLANELFAVCQQDSEIRLVVLDAETGKLKWIQQLGTIETNSNRVDVQADRFRRLAGVTPSFSNGILVCATGTGALVAVDLSTRSLLWGYQYTTPGSKSIQRLSPFNVSKTDKLGGLWRDSTIVISDGRVMFTPVDSQDMICVNLQNGHPAWKQKGIRSSKTPRRESLYLACVENGKAILVGGEQIRAINLSTGEKQWVSSLEGYGRPSGRGYANRGSYYLPTTNEKLLQIELETGKFVKAVKTDGVLGNLICYRGEVISHSVDRVATFPQDEPSRKRIQLAVDAGEVSPQLLAIKAQIEFQDGNLTQAIASIENSYQQSPKLSSEELLLDLLLQQIDKNYDVGIELAEKYEPQLLKKRRLDYLAAKINGMIRDEQPDAALESIFQLIEPLDEFLTLSSESLTLPTSTHDASVTNESTSETVLNQKTIVQMDCWIGSRIGLIYERSSKATKQLIEERISRYASSIVLFQPEEQFQILNLFPKSTWPAKFTQSLAQAFTQEGNSLRAIKLSNSILESESDAPGLASANATLQLASVYMKCELWDQAIEKVEILESKFSNSEVTFEGSDQTGADVARALRGLIPTQLDLRSETNWNRGTVTTTSTSPELDPDALLSPSVIELKNYDRPVYAKYQFRFHSRTGEIEILDEFGNSAYRFAARQNADSIFRSYNIYKIGHVSIKDNLAILDIDSEVFAFDWLKLNTDESPMLWNRNAKEMRPSMNPISFESTWGETRIKTSPNTRDSYPVIAGAGLNGICMLEGRQLIGLDAITGIEIWRRVGFDPDSILLSGENHIVAWNPKNRIAHVIDAKDGRVIQTNSIPPSAGAFWTNSNSRILFAGRRQLNREIKTASEKSKQATDNADSDKSYVEDPGKIEQFIGLYDLNDGQFVWEKTYPFKTLACRVEGKRLAILPPKGELEIINIATGKTEVRSSVQLSALKRRRITGIGVHVTKGTYLVHLKKGETQNRVDFKSGTNFIEARYVNYNDPMWVGYIVGINSTTGENLWRTPVRFENFQVLQGQPFSCPLYFLNRRLDIDSELGDSSSYLQFVGIDVETGKLRVNGLNEFSYQNSFRLNCLPEQQKLQINYRGIRLTYDFESQTDLPPRPVAQVADYNSIRMKQDSDDRVDPFDPTLIELEKVKSLKRAQAAQALLPQKRADEKKKLEAEKNGK